MEPVVLVRDQKRNMNAIVPIFIVPPPLKLASLSVIEYAAFYMNRVFGLPKEIIMMIVERTTLGWALRQLVPYTPPTLQ